MLKVVTNHIGYDFNKPKHAVIVADSKLASVDYKLVDADNGSTVSSGKAIYSGPVDKWKNWQFWTIDFSNFTKEGNYKIEVVTPGKTVSSYPFTIGRNVLERNTISDVVYYFKGQRSSGLLDKADHQLHFSGGKTDSTVDAHGGWYDATGDYGKHLSHLSFSIYFNPQQISLTAWSLFKTYEYLAAKPGTDYRQYMRRILDEAMYGADYLTRMQVKNGSFYRSVGAPGPGKLPKDRSIQPDEGSYRIKQNKDQSFTKNTEANPLKSYLASYRSGGGLAIAALAMASTYPVSGDYSNADYLKAAENAFAFLEKQNPAIDYDGKENILDDYCALTAATELYKVTHKAVYKTAADKRTMNLLKRLSSWKSYKNYWRADDKDRPFFHPSDAGLPVVSLLYYYRYASADLQKSIKSAVKSSMEYELSITHEVNNPFGYSRQLVQDTLGNRRSAFFFPHGSEASPWWQGENARLSSMASAAKLAAITFKDDTAFSNKLQSFAADQLNWTLGLNPYNACMLQGTGHNNPAYGFFGTFEYTNAPGGIVNGITSGFENENDIDFNLPYSQTHKDADWRWAEQWLPHTAWFLLAVSMP
ncbi:glycoside hydrolase family 9 protein [Mucilaginibacter sp. KACC 22063]|uniref:glycoside hydrolase family 9 protein n=1 Tax=Mucilaginibacter sp. KACC 22063 TaxID=3025666 RepID=UPI002366F2DB|nr:glycoside hydrolase family 9 protein [Mucilaginibacter sp. KACC 22063]WDF55655.1 glycoside hydrolase family 9 protein [Mucilaginibacter sp. KACC 22063]